jgi:daunorubicin/doxorubicin transport system permease protein
MPVSIEAHGARPQAGTETGTMLRSVLSAAPRPSRASALSASLSFGWRGMLKVKHVPEQLLDATLTPVLFLLMFNYMFGGAVAGSTTDYLQFLLPGILVISVLFTTVYSGVALNTDVTKRVVDRFRSLPIARPAPLVGALLGDTVRYLVAATVIVTLGVAMGYRPEAGVGGVVGAVLLVIVFAFGLSWVFTTLGMLLRAPNAVTNAGFMFIFPLTFLSNVFVNPGTLPGWLQGFVDVNPITKLVDASRGLMEGSATVGQILVPLATAAALTLVFAPLTTRLYRKAH